MKKFFTISLMVVLIALLLTACQGVQSTITPTGNVPVTGNQETSKNAEFSLKGEISDLSEPVKLASMPPSDNPVEGVDAPVEKMPRGIATPPQISAPAGCNASFNSDFESVVLRQINKERAKRNLKKLTRQPQLIAAAREHTLDMACNNYFSHTSLDGRSPFDRIRAAGYSYRIAAENLYAGNGAYNNPKKAVAAWMNSAGHRKNILTAGVVHIGVSYVYNPNSTYGGYLTVTFGAPLKK